MSQIRRNAWLGLNHVVEAQLGGGVTLGIFASVSAITQTTPISGLRLPFHHRRDAS
ncbi:hypothetical protein [Alicyclobacillus kakegawensis]|uniref:hypothetical protein n=1 Tax=Alicyclobacillus kakegawensis TaxID=392012 RepID=UPI000A9F199F|nr:hypothetical protein [Alicyclobacillus kakegawensis]